MKMKAFDRSGVCGAATREPVFVISDLSCALERNQRRRAKQINGTRKYILLVVQWVAG